MLSMPSDAEATRRWLNDIWQHIVKSETFIASMDDEAFKGDDLRLYAVTRCLKSSPKRLVVCQTS